MGLVELTAPYCLETAQKKKYGQTCKALFWALRQRILDEKGWHHNVCQADECTLHKYYLCYSDWDKSSYVFINDSTTTTSCSQYLSH